MATGGEHHHAARVADGERGADVLPEVELLQGHGVGGVLLQQRIHAGIDVDQSSLDWQPGGGLDDAAVECGHAPASARHHAVASVGQAGVDAEHDHDEGFCAAGRTPPRNVCSLGC